MYKPKRKSCYGGILCDKHKEHMQLMWKYVASSLKANVNILVLSNLWEDYDRITCFTCVKIFWRTKYYNTTGTLVIQWDVNKWPCILYFSGKKNHKWTKSRHGTLNKTLIQNEECKFNNARWFPASFPVACFFHGLSFLSVYRNYSRRTTPIINFCSYTTDISFITLTSIIISAAIIDRNLNRTMCTTWFAFVIQKNASAPRFTWLNNGSVVFDRFISSDLVQVFNANVSFTAR